MQVLYDFIEQHLKMVKLRNSIIYKKYSNKSFINVVYRNIKSAKQEYESSDSESSEYSSGIYEEHYEYGYDYGCRGDRYFDDLYDEEDSKLYGSHDDWEDYYDSIYN